MPLTPRTEAGTAPATYNVTGVYRQILIENRDTVDSLGFKLNDETTAYTLDPGSRVGLRKNGGIYAVVLTGTADFQFKLL